MTDTPNTVTSTADIQEATSGVHTLAVPCPTCQMGINHILIGAYQPDSDEDTERFILTGQSVVPASGVGVIEFPPISPGQDWHIERVTFACDGATGGVGTVRIDSPIDPTAIVMSAASATLAVVENTQPVYARAYQRVYVVFTAATVGATVFTRIQYNLQEGDPVKDN